MSDYDYYKRAWYGMIRRCAIPESKDYPNYGGRGISVCLRWTNFDNFRADMGDRPSELHQLDRMDNNGDYNPQNCRWVTKSEQMINRRIQRNNKSGKPGVSYDVARDMWWAQIKRNGDRKYLGHYDNLADAVVARENAEKKYSLRKEL